MPGLKFVADPNLEAFLKKRGVRFKSHEDFPLGDIDLEQSQHNEARRSVRGGLVQDKVDDLRRLAEAQGLTVPMLLLYKDPDGKTHRCYVLCDGNHRLEVARQLKMTTVGAYEVVGANADTIRMLTETVNVLVGHGNRADEMLNRGAEYFIDHEGKPGITLEKVAAAYNAKKSEMGRAVRIKKVKRRLSNEQDLAVPGWGRHKKTKYPFLVLSGLKTNGKVKREFARLIFGGEKLLKEGDMWKVAEKIETAAGRSEKSGLEAVEKERVALHEREEEVKKMSARERAQDTASTRLIGEVTRAVNKLEELLPKSKLVKNVVTAPKKQNELWRLVQRFKPIARRIDEELKPE